MQSCQLKYQIETIFYRNLNGLKNISYFKDFEEIAQYN